MTWVCLLKGHKWVNQPHMMRRLCIRCLDMQDL